VLRSSAGISALRSTPSAIRCPRPKTCTGRLALWRKKGGACSRCMPTLAIRKPFSESGIKAWPSSGAGESIVITSSTAGISPRTDWGAGSLGYVAAKAGVIGVMKLTALRLGKYSIRCNTVHPTGVRTPMIENPGFEQYVIDNQDYVDKMQNALPTHVIDPVDVSNMMLFLCSDEARYVTGETFLVDAGYSVS
jgi:NAD(P)-dependent dehydrogenase (short-subunit alcohol dehydrogenase family)